MSKLVKEKLNEILTTENVYDITLDEEVYTETSKIYRYSFITKKDIKYTVLLTVRKNGEARIDFDTRGLKDDKYDSVIHLINSGDTIKVLNTLKAIINNHKDDIDKLIISSTRDRIKFYKKILDYLNIENYMDGEKRLIGILN
ncbi:MAG: hypothetical protein ACOC1O_00555 [bacterium]